MKLHIARLRLRLPAGYAARGEAVAHAVAQAAAGLRPAASRSVDALALGAVSVPATASDGEIGAAVASRLASRLGGGT